MAVQREDHTLGKDERLTGRKLVETLFANRPAHSLAAYPLRAVYLLTEANGAEQRGARILVSVSKRHFKQAVRRNRVKRQVREAYRLNKHLLCVPEGKTLLLAFIWQDDRLRATSSVEKRMRKLLEKLSRQL